MNARGIITESIRYLGDVPRAVILNESLLMFARERLAPLDLWLPILLTAKSLNDAGNYTRAQGLLDELMMLLMSIFGAKHGYYSNLFDTAACVASGRGDAIRAAKLLAISDVELTMMNGRRFSNNDMEIAPYIAKARAALGEEAYAAAYAEGRAMTVEQAIDYALGQDPKSLGSLGIAVKWEKIRGRRAKQGWVEKGGVNKEEQDGRSTNNNPVGYTECQSGGYSNHDTR